MERGRTQDQLPLTAELFKMNTLGICATSCLRFGEGEENWFGQVGINYMRNARNDEYGYINILPQKQR